MQFTWNKQLWLLRSETTPGQYNVAHSALEDVQKYLSPLPIKLGLKKNRWNQWLKYTEGLPIQEKFLSKWDQDERKNFCWSTNYTNIQRKDFRTKLNFKERRAWKAFEKFCRNFIGKEKEENYSEIMHDLISSRSAMGCNMSLKRYFLHSHLDVFPENLEAVSEGHGENFSQDISEIEKGVQWKWSPYMLAEYYCSLIRDTLTGESKRQKKAKGVYNNFFLFRIKYILTLFTIWQGVL